MEAVFFCIGSIEAVGVIAMHHHHHVTSNIDVHMLPSPTRLQLGDLSGPSTLLVIVRDRRGCEAARGVTLVLGPSVRLENLRLPNLTPASHCRTGATDRPTTP
jgi:hypothetical protein